VDDCFARFNFWFKFSLPLFVLDLTGSAIRDFPFSHLIIDVKCVGKIPHSRVTLWKCQREYFHFIYLFILVAEKVHKLKYVRSFTDAKICMRFAMRLLL